MRGGREAFDALVLNAGPGLYRVAFLLSGRGDEASRLAELALVHVRRRWADIEESGEPEQAALKALVRAWLGQGRRRVAAENLPTLAEDSEALQREELWRALDELSRSERAALVLDHLPRDAWPVSVDASVVLGRRASGLQAAATARLVSAGLDASEALIRATLDERVRWQPVREPSVEAVNSAVRRRAWRLAASGAALAVIIGGVALATSQLTSNDQARPSPTPSATTARSPDAGELEPPVPWPTRGNLANRADVINELRVEFARQNRFVVGGIQVLYAADVGADRLALVGGVKDTAAPVFQWFIGPADGSRPWVLRNAELPVVDGKFQTASYLLALSHGRGVMVLVGPPGMKAQVSWRPSYPQDGTIARAFEPLAMTDGTALVDLDIRTWSLVRLRIAEEANFIDDQPIPLDRVTLQFVWPPDDPRLVAKFGTADRDLVRGALGQLAVELGIPSPDELMPRVIWGGQVDGQEAIYARVKLRSGGEFGVVSLDGNTHTWVVPRGAPDFPIAWNSVLRTNSLTVNVLAGPEVQRVEFLVRGEVALEGEVSSYSPRRFEAPFDPAQDWLDAKVVMYDSHDEVRWTRPIFQLPGPNPTD